MFVYELECLGANIVSEMEQSVCFCVRLCVSKKNQSDFVCGRRKVCVCASMCVCERESTLPKSSAYQSHGF